MSLTDDTMEAPVIPIVLAGGSNLQAWPLSRIHRPAQFQRVERAPSNFQQALACANRLVAAGALDPIVSVTALSLPIARQQIGQSEFDLAPQIILEAVERGSWPAVVTCALLAALKSRSALMVIIDANDPPGDIDAFERLVVQTRNSPMVQESVIMCGAPSTNEGEGLHLIKGNATADTLLHEAHRATPGMHAGVYAAGKVAFMTPRTLLQLSDKRTLETCNKAFQLAQTMSGALWPAINVWSNLQSKDLFDVLSQQSGTLLRIVDLKGSPDRRQAKDDVFTEGCSQCHVTTSGHLVALAGVSDLEVTATRDATLVTRRGAGLDREMLVNRLRAAERHELFQPIEIAHDWGQETQIDRRRAYSVMRLEIYPGAKIQPHMHKSRSETWLVVSGQGEVRCGSTRRIVAPGNVFEMPPGTVHSCSNTGQHELIILETRLGSYLGEGDVIRVNEIQPEQA